jgi:hypothetical protein
MRFPVQLALAIAILFSAPAFAADPPTKRRDAAGNELTVYELEVSPAPEPPLAMKYRLLPDPAELKPGNAATQYYKACVFEFAENPLLDAVKRFEGLMDVPFARVDVNELRKALTDFDDHILYSSMRAATYRRDCDWELGIREEGAFVLLPSVQQLRAAGIVLAMKAKLQIAEGKFDEAIANARDAFTLSRNMQAGESLVQALVGISISSVLQTTFFHDWIAADNSPNLYWSVATLPPRFDSRRIIGTELKFPEFTFHELKHLNDKILSADEANNLALRVWHADRVATAIDKNNLQGRAKLLLWATTSYDESHRDLEKHGYAKERLDAMPVAQVALLARWVRYQHLRDDLEKRVLYAYAHNDPTMLNVVADMARKHREAVEPFHDLIPPFVGFASAQRRQARWLAAIATIEALRMHAADKGAWPARLEEIKQVPLPKNPDDNKPFAYKFDGDVAVLTAPYATGITHEYRLKLRKK